jgi:hypothetical protein
LAICCTATRRASGSACSSSRRAGGGPDVPRGRQRLGEIAHARGVEDEDEAARVVADPGNAADVVAPAERRRRPEIGAAGAEDVGHRVDDESGVAPGHVDHDPLGLAGAIGAIGAIGAGQPEAHPQIDDRHHLAAIVGDAHDLGRRVRKRHDVERVGDLLHPRNRHRVVHLAHDEADEALRGVVAVALPGALLNHRASLPRSAGGRGG